MPQSFEITVTGLEAASQKDLKWQQVRGKVVTADAEDGITIEKILEASQAGKGLDINWAHGDNRREHSFIIGGILRGDRPSRVVLRWDGSPIGVDKKVCER